MSNFELLIVGELNADIIINDDDPRPIFGQREKFVRSISMEMGSASAIMACGAQKLGLRTAISGKVGNDPFGSIVLDTLEERGVDIGGVIIDEQVKTGATVHLSSPTDRAMITYAGSMAEFSAEEVPIDLVQRSCHIHVSSYFLQQKLRIGLPQLFKRAREIGLTTSLDPGWDPSEKWDINELLPLIDILLPNERELWNIANQSDTREALQQVGEIVPLVAVKCGERGAMAYSRGKFFTVPAYKVSEVIDTTGAGDSFNAGFLYRYLRGGPIKESLQWGCICGSLVVTKIGGIAGQPTADEIESLINSIK